MKNSNSYRKTIKAVICSSYSILFWRKHAFELKYSISLINLRFIFFHLFLFHVHCLDGNTSSINYIYDDFLSKLFDFKRQFKHWELKLSFLYLINEHFFIIPQYSESDYWKKNWVSIFLCLRPKIYLCFDFNLGLIFWDISCNLFQISLYISSIFSLANKCFSNYFLRIMGKHYYKFIPFV